jgi:hypothetical protein
MCTDTRGSHQPPVTAASVLDVKVEATVVAAELGAEVTGADVVELSRIMNIILGSSGRP